MQITCNDDRFYVNVPVSSILRSNDHGQSWQPTICERGLPEWFLDNINIGTLAMSQNFAVFGTSDGQSFLSDDAGLTW